MVNTRNINYIRFKRKMRKRRIITLSITFILLFLLGYFSREIYIKSSCKDLDFAVQHYMTNGNSDNRLMRVKTMSLIFSDNDSAIIQAYGLRKTEPHISIGIEGHFKKDAFNSWTLEATYPILTSN